MPGYARPPYYSSTEIQFLPTGNISSSNIQSAIQEVDAEKIDKSIVDAKGDLIIGTANDTVSRLAVGNNGYVLTASSSATGGLSWQLAAAGATGGGTNQVFYENDLIVNQNYTITTNKNAGTFGPVSIADGTTVTIPDGSTWVVA